MSDHMLATHDAAHTGICARYVPRNRGTPANLRKDFQFAVSRLAATGGGLLHVQHPRDLGPNEEAFRACLATLEARHLIASFDNDPPPAVVAVGQQLMDTLFGEQAYRVVPSGLVWRQYGKAGILDSATHAPVVYFQSRSQIGTALVLAKAHELERAGFTGSRPLLMIVGAAAVLRDLVEQASPLVAALSSVDHRFGPEYRDLFRGVANAVERETYLAIGLQDPTEAVGLAATLAFPLARISLEAALRDVSVDDDCKDFLTVLLSEANGNPAISVLLNNAAVDPLTRTGFVAWCEQIARNFADFTLPHVSASYEDLADPGGGGETEHTTDPPLQPSPSLGDFDAVCADVAERIDDLHTLLEAAESAAMRAEQELSDANQQASVSAKLQARARQHEHEAANALSDRRREAEALQTEALRVRATKLFNVLTMSRGVVDSIRDRLAQLAIAPDDPQIASARGLLAAIDQMERSGAYSQLPAAARTALDDQRDAARVALGGKAGVSLTTPSTLGFQSELRVPMAFSLARDGDHTNIILALPVAGPEAKVEASEGLDAGVVGVLEAIGVALREALLLIDAEPKRALVQHVALDTISLLQCSLPTGKGGEAMTQEELEMGLDECLRLTDLGAAHVSWDIRSILPIDVAALEAVARGI